MDKGDALVEYPPEFFEPQSDRGRATRMAILGAAEEVFGELSYDAASIAEITRRAGVAQGTFYVYFPDKKSAFIELVRRLNQNMRTTIATATAGIAGRLDVERAGFRAFFAYVSEHKTLYRVVRESEFVDPDIYRWHYATLANGYVHGLESAQAKGEVTSHVSADIMAWLLMGIAEFVGGRWVLGEEGEVPEQVLDEIMCFVERAIHPDGAA